MLDWLKGKKTYVVLLAAILTAIGAYLSGNMELAELIKTIFGAITGMTIRAGITKSGK